MLHIFPCMSWKHIRVEFRKTKSTDVFIFSSFNNVFQTDLNFNFVG